MLQLGGSPRSDLHPQRVIGGDSAKLQRNYSVFTVPSGQMIIYIFHCEIRYVILLYLYNM